LSLHNRNAEIQKNCFQKIKPVKNSDTKINRCYIKQQLLGKKATASSARDNYACLALLIYFNLR